MSKSISQPELRSDYPCRQENIMVRSVASVMLNIGLHIFVSRAATERRSPTFRGAAEKGGILGKAIVGLLLAALACSFTAAAGAERDYPYFELQGTVVEFRDIRHWRAYYWREDFTLVVRDEDGRRWRIISREPTPWNNLRLGTTYTGLAVGWKAQPQVKIIGVQAIDRAPAEFYDLKLDPKNTATAFIVRVRESDKSPWQDYYVNNWFHRWGKQTDLRMLPHYANDDPHYTVYGYVGGIAAPFDAAGQKLLDESSTDYSGIIYHGRLVKADNPVGYELRVLHLMGRHKKTLRYEVFHGDATELVPLDQKKPE